MSDAHFFVEVDADLDLVTITLSGFFSPDDVKRLSEARNEAHRTLRCGPNQHSTLIDSRGIKIQAQDSVMAFTGLLANPEHRSRKLAFVVSQSLTRSQVLRAAASRTGELFLDIDQARAWLLADSNTRQPQTAAA